MALDVFHPIIRHGFTSRFGSPTEAQRLGWPAIHRGRDTLIAAPTGSGKTLAAFLASLDPSCGGVGRRTSDQTSVVYVSPLRALSNDIQRNLQGPLAEILELARRESSGLPGNPRLVRTGDTPAERTAADVRRPPHILVTTPESLYLVLTGKRSREILRHVETVIVDEIHAVARDKRGSHLALSLERLEALCARRGRSASACRRRRSRSTRLGAVPGGHALRRPDDRRYRPFPRHGPGGRSAARWNLQAVCTHEHWAEVYERLVQLIDEHRSTLIFVNTRKLAERVAHQLTERLGEDQRAVAPRQPVAPQPAADRAAVSRRAA